MSFIQNHWLFVLLFVFLHYGLLISQYIDISDETCTSYFVSPTVLNWRSANNYCRNICGSSLVSIHSIEDHICAESAVENAAFIDWIRNRKIWIGLYYSTRDKVWRWSDYTSFDFGNIFDIDESTINTSNPWNQNISITDLSADYDTLSCVSMNIDNEYEWEIETGDECIETGIVICNHCDGKIIKYGLINNMSTLDEAENICDNEMDTTILSIHNEDEYIQSKRLCLYGTDAVNDCWIGLKQNQSVTQLNIDAQYQWMDASQWNYGANISIYPWSHTINHDDDDDAQCVALSANHSYLWIKDNCFKKKRVMCAIPSELCYANNWIDLYNHTHESVQLDECQIDYGIQSPNKLNEIVNIGKQWKNSNGELMIEYVFEMTQVNNGSGSIAVSLYNVPGSICDYYNIGITVKGNKRKIFVTRYYDNVYNEIYSVYINTTKHGESNAYNVLNIIIVNGTQFNVKLNDVQYILIGDEYLNETKRPSNDISGFIGLKTYNVLIHSTSLYVSGSPLNIDINQTEILYKFNDCALKTTLEPISTLNTLETHKLCITVEFRYESDKSIIQNTTNFIKSIDCLQSINDAAVNVSVIGLFVTINAVIFVCNINYTKTILAEYIQNIADISQQQILFNCTLIEDFVITPKERKYVYVVIGIGVFVCCLCIAMVLIIHRSRKINDSETQDRDEYAGKNQKYLTGNLSESDLVFVEEYDLSEEASAQRKLINESDEVNSEHTKDTQQHHEDVESFSKL